MTAFDHQQPSRMQEVGCLRENNAYSIQSIVATGKGQRRFAAVFLWQRTHDTRAHVRWIGYDQVVTSFSQRLKIV